MRSSKSLLTLRNKADIGKISLYYREGEEERERGHPQELRYVLLAPGDKLAEKALHGISA